MRIDKMIDNNNAEKMILTNTSAYAIISLINSRLNSISSNDASIIAEFFINCDYDIDYSSLVNAANSFIQNNFNNYSQNTNGEEEISTIQ